MSSKLKGKKPKEVTPRKPKLILFGEAGVGKTWETLAFPQVYFIDVENGASSGRYQDRLDEHGASYLGVEDGSNDMGVVRDQLQALYTEDHDFRTVVIDSGSKLFNGQVLDEAETLAKAGTKNEFGLDKKLAIAKFRPVVTLIEKLDMNVIIVCHEKVKYKNGEVVGSTFDCWDKLDYDLDLTAQVVKRGKSRYIIPKKSRLEHFPEGQSIEWSFSEFRERYEREFGEGILSRQATAAQLATDETFARFDQLRATLKTEDAKLSKWLKAAKVDRFPDMEERHLKQCVAALEKELKAAA